MNSKLKSILLKIVRILLPAGAFALGCLPGSFTLRVKETPDALEILEFIPTNYFDMRVFDAGNWAPMICMLLLVASVVVAIYCVFKENENSLIVLANILIFTMIAAVATLLFQHITWIGWLMVLLIFGDIVITSIQEIKMEKASKKF